MGDVGTTIGGAAEIINLPFKISGTDPMALGPLGGAEMGLVEGMASLGMLLRGVSYADEIAVAAKGGFIDPSKVRFTQDSIGAAFKNGQSIDDVASALRGPGGADLAREFPAIRLVERDGQLFTLDNRRLATFSAGGQQVPYRMATPAEIAKEWGAKFTTTAEQGWGQFISVRPPKR